MRQLFATALAGFALTAPFPAAAEVASASDAGFVSHNTVLVDASPAEAWAALVRPAAWWNPDHSYSGDAANLSLSAAAGGCFCEALPATGGAVEHMRVIQAAPGTLLRLSGALGPLQSEAVTAVLTMTLTPEGEMTRIAWDYVVGGYIRAPMTSLAPQVDAVIGEQLLRLAAHLGTKVDPVSRRF